MTKGQSSKSDLDSGRSPNQELIEDPNNPGQKIVRQSFAITLITQGNFKFYSLTVESDILAKVCAVSTRDDDPAMGFQRHLDKKRATEIATYIDKDLGTIPNSVILSAQSAADLVYTSKNRSVRFNLVPGAFLILDGQHRVYGYSLAKTKLRVPVIIYTGLTRAQESRLFIDINTKQRAVPSNLLLDIKRLAESETDEEQILTDVFTLFKDDPNSALFGLLSTSKAVDGKIGRSTFNMGIKQVLPLFSEKDPSLIYTVSSEYIHAFRAGLKSKKLDDLFVTASVFRASMAFFGETLRSVKLKYGAEYNAQNFFEILQPMFNNLRPNTFRNASGSISELTELYGRCLSKGFTI